MIGVVGAVEAAGDEDGDTDAVALGIFSRVTRSGSEGARGIAARWTGLRGGCGFAGEEPDGPDGAQRGQDVDHDDGGKWPVAGEALHGEDGEA